MELELMFKDVTLKEDKNGSHLVVKQIGLYKEGEFIKDAKLNEALVEQIKKGKIIFTY